MLKKKEDSFLPDREYDGKSTVYLDIDRIINEGMAGGNVYSADGRQNIEEAHDFYDEVPPNTNK